MSFFGGMSSDFINKLKNISGVDAGYGDYSNVTIKQIKDDLKLFEQVEDNTASTDDKNAMQAQATLLKGKLEELIAQMGELQEKLQEKEGDINAKTEEIEGYVLDVEDSSKTYKNNVKKAVEDAIEDTLKEVKNMKQGQNSSDVGSFYSILTGKITKYVGKISPDAMNAALDNIASNKSAVNALIDETSGLMDQVDGLKLRYATLNSTYQIIQRTVQSIGNTNTNYKNVDADTKVPVYSAGQALEITDLKEKFTVGATNSVYDPNAKPVNLDDTLSAELKELNEKYSKYYTATATPGVDANSANNAAVANLSKAINAGLIKDIQKLGLSKTQIANFFVKNFAGTPMKISGGKFSVPYGHGSEAHNAFGAVVSAFNAAPNTPNNSSIYLGELDKASKYGNSIHTNDQLKALGENYKEILTKLGSEGYSFKEAMYFMFDSEKGIFNNSGVKYDLSTQAGGAHYGMNLAGDADTAKIYEGMAKLIYDIWGIKSDNEINREALGLDQFGDSGDNPIPPKPIRTDPLSLQLGDKTFSFIIDRNNDGAFDKLSEFVGGSTETNWVQDLLQFDKDGDGILKEDELEQLKLLGAKDTDARGDHDVEYTTMSALSLGITSIDLNAYLKRDENGTLVVDTSKLDTDSNNVDINNSLVRNDFSQLGITYADDAKLKGATLSRKEETQEYLQTIYGDALGRSNTISVSDTAETFDKFLAGADGQLGLSPDALDGYNYLKNFDAILDGAEKYVDEAIKASSKYRETREREVKNEYHESVGNSNWTSIQSDINDLLRSGAYDASQLPNDYLNQAQGLYARNTKLSAKEILNQLIADKAFLDSERVTNYKQDSSKADEINNSAMTIISECAKKDIVLSFAEALEAAKDGKTAKDIIAEKQQK